MVVWSVAAVWLASFVFLFSLACPWLTRTRKGLLYLHWVAVNVLDSTWALPHLDSLLSSLSLLYPLATTIFLIEIALTAGQSESELQNSERFILCTFVVVLDVLCLIYGGLAHLEISTILFVILIYLGLYLTFMKVKSPFKMTMKERVSLHSADLFYDWQNPLQCLGLLGKLHLFSIISSLFLQASVVLYRQTHLAAYIWQYMSHLPPQFQMSFLPASHVIIWLLYISRSVCTLGVLVTPTGFGAFTNTGKTFGAYLANRKKLKQRDTLIEQT